MANILCLAHYCDTHGPTPLMVTEGLPVDCSSCIDEDHGFDLRRLSIASRSLVNNNENTPTSKSTSSRTNSSSSVDNENAGFGHRHNSTSAIVDTPPESPRMKAAPFPLARDSSFRKTYTDADKARASPCENCALTLPPETNEQVPKTKLDSNGPILRTRKPYARVKTLQERSPPQSMSSSASESEETEESETDNTTRVKESNELPLPKHLKRTNTSSSSSTVSSSTSSCRSTSSHEHYFDYTSSHEPLLPTSFSVIRQSCLRTLSMETLPPSSQPSASAAYATLSTSTASGGPIFFGDNQAGFTIAFKFRVPDPTARGRRRQYAFIMHSTHKERIAMSFFTQIGTRFQELAAWIQGLADVQLERTENFLHSPQLRAIDESRSNSSSNVAQVNDYRRGSDGTTSSSASVKNSAFLGGRSRSSFNGPYGGGPGGYNGMGGVGGGSLKGKGLAELVGQPDIFFRLHIEFVGMLIGMGRMIGGA